MYFENETGTVGIQQAIFLIFVQYKISYVQYRSRNIERTVRIAVFIRFAKFDARKRKFEVCKHVHVQKLPELSLQKMILWQLISRLYRLDFKK